MLTFNFSQAVKGEKQPDKFVFIGENTAPKVIFSMACLYLSYFVIIFFLIFFKNIDVLRIVAIAGGFGLFISSVFLFVKSRSYYPIIYFEFSKKGIFCSEKNDKSINRYLEKDNIHKLQIVQEQNAGKTKIFIFVNGGIRNFAYFELAEKISVDEWTILLEPYWASWGVKIKNKITHDTKGEILLEKPLSEKNSENFAFDTKNKINTTQQQEVLSGLSGFSVTFLEDANYFVINTDTTLKKTISIVMFAIGFFVTCIFGAVLVFKNDFFFLIPVLLGMFFMGIALYEIFFFDAPQQIQFNKLAKNILLKYKKKEVLIENDKLQMLHFAGQYRRNKSSINYYTEITLETKGGIFTPIITLYPKLNFDQNTQGSIYVYGQSIVLAEKLSDILGVKYDWKDDWRNA